MSASDGAPRDPSPAHTHDPEAPPPLPPTLDRVVWAWWILLTGFLVLWQARLVATSLAAFAVVCVLLLAPAAWIEVRRGVLTAFLASLFRSRRKTAWFLLLFLTAAAKFYWIPGYRLYTMGDGPPHFLNTWMVYDALRNGEIPFWTNFWACGSPFLQFYPPLFAYLSAALLFVHENIFLAIRFVLFVLHLLSGVAMYRLVRAMDGSRGAAFLSAVAYVLAPWHVFQVFHFNRFPVAAVYTLLPLLFLSTELVRRDRLAALLLGGASLGGIALSHQGYAIFASALFGIYTLIRAFPLEDRPVLPRLRYLLHGAGVGVLGIGLAAFLLFPHLLESHLLPFLPSMSKAEGVRGFIMDNPYLASLFLWSRKPMGHSGYLGISLFVLGLLGLVVLVRRRSRGWAALLGCLALSYYLVVGHENALYRFIPFVYSQFYAGRYIIFLVFFLSLLAGFSLPYVRAALVGPDPGARPPGPVRGFLGRRVLLLCLGLLLIDLAPVSQYLQVSPRYYPADQGAVYRAIRARHERSPHQLARAADIPRDLRMRNHGSLILPLESRIATPEAGQFGTLASYGYVYKILKSAREEVPLDRRFSGLLRQALYLLNVRYVFTDIFTREEARSLGGEGFGGELRLFTLPEAAPVLASSRIEDLGDRWLHPDNPLDMVLDRWSPPDAVDRIVGAMGIRTADRTADRILVRDAPSDPPAYPSPPGPVRISDEVLGTTFLRLTVSTGAPCYLRLSQSIFPYQEVLLDGEPCSRVYRSAMDFVVLPFPGGEHTLEVRSVLSPVRKICLTVSGFVLLLLIALTAVYAARRRRRAPA